MAKDILAKIKHVSMQVSEVLGKDSGVKTYANES